DISRSRSDRAGRLASVTEAEPALRAVSDCEHRTLRACYCSLCEARSHHFGESRAYPLMCSAVAKMRFVCAAVILAAVSTPAAGQNGYEAALRQCVADIQASLHGRSILGSRDTAEYIQSRGFLEDRVGVTEYDLLVWRCQAEINRRHVDRSPRRPAAA